jgi:tetratricopeptide (TPR) repeat protein
MKFCKKNKMERKGKKIRTIRSLLLSFLFLFSVSEIVGQTPVPVKRENCLIVQNEELNQWTLYQCGEEFIATKSDGTKWKCQCTCDYPGQDLGCVQIIDGNTTTNYVPSAPSQADLDAYYNAQWTGYLYEQADIEFKKGLKSFNAGKCDKAVKQFENAAKFADLEIYDDYLNAAKYCRDTQELSKTKKEKQEFSVNVTTLSRDDSIAYVEAQNLQKDLQVIPDAICTNIWGDTYLRRDYELNPKVVEVKKSLVLADSTNQKPSKCSAKKLDDVNVGDVILVGPNGDSWFSKKQAYADALISDANARVTHTLTCVKVTKEGKRIFMDNQGDEGPRMISEAEFKIKYEGRQKHVASMKNEPFGVATPVSVKEADSIWQMARRLVQKNKDNENGWMGKNNYGLWGDDQLVCSEASWMLVNVTGRYKIPVSNFLLSKIGGIDFTPASFFKDTKYFLITKFEMD